MSRYASEYSNSKRDEDDVKLRDGEIDMDTGQIFKFEMNTIGDIKRNVYKKVGLGDKGEGLERVEQLELWPYEKDGTMRRVNQNFKVSDSEELNDDYTLLDYEIMNGDKLV